VLSRDPDGAERCVACYLCAVACPVDCITLQATEDETGRRYPESFRINFSRCIFCGYYEEAYPTYAIQLTPDPEMGEYDRQNLVNEKEDLLIDGPGKFLLFGAGLKARQWGPVAVLVLGSILTLVYYSRILVVMYKRPKSGKSPKMAPALLLDTSVTLGVITSTIVTFGIYPNPLLALIQSMAAAL
jgi:ferredoxin